MTIDITTVADDLVVVHEHDRVRRYEGLKPATEHFFDGVEAVTLPRPPGQLLCHFATVNDVHFGEEECGKIDDDPQGPIQRSRPGEPPYPEVMNRAACREIATIDPEYVLVKGDLTAKGTPEEFAAFEDCYRGSFGDRLQVVRGNHDAYLGQQIYADDLWIEMPGLCVALMDTTIPTQTTGAFEASQIEWLDQHASQTDRPVLVMGHHQQWTDGKRSDDYFGLHPDSSDALAAVVERRRNILGYTAGHTHRHRVRTMSCGVPTVEIGCLKDFPGTWAEYRVFEGGVMQVVHRVSSPEALEWSERCRYLYSDFGIDYQSYALGRLEDRCFVFPDRA
jgi:3',5'-cyclic-AMP phosphodiesterase